MEVIPSFSIARLPRLTFGAGAIESLPAEAKAIGDRALIVTGGESFRRTARWPWLLAALRQQGVASFDMAVRGEPSPELVDAAVCEFAGKDIRVVVGIGGGSALDAAKAIAGLLPHGHSVMEHLEGVGPEKPYRGPAVPLIAVPTTAGTGSEATKNAVLSRHGTDGFKKSFRDEQLVARLAIVDPDMLASCPPDVIAANGMDAFTQLLESYVSIRANPLTDALAWSGMEAFVAGFFAFFAGTGAEAAAGRARVAYASFLSGACLAQTGLGSVHGLASPLGAYFPIPHGMCCGTLVAEATAVNVAALRNRLPHSPALAKYARIGQLLAGPADGESGPDGLIEGLREWTDRLPLARLSAYGMQDADVNRVVAASRGSSMKTNPLVLTDDEIATVIRRRL